MAQLQYIGARYVPVWYQNSIDDSSNWEINVEYEPLTFVTTPNNHLYLSKKQVPDNIGTPAQNTEYWLDMGYFGGSYPDLEPRVADLENEMTTAQGDISSLQSDVSSLTTDINKKEINQQSRKYIFVFDSYGALGLSTAAQAAAPGGSDVLNIGGAGFIGNGGGQSWGDALLAFCQSKTAAELATYTDIMFFGGINDYAFTPTNIVLAIKDVKDNIIDVYLPDIRVTIAPISWSIRADTSLSEYCQNVFYGYSLACARYGYRYAEGLGAFIHADIFMAANDVHPNSSGAAQLAEALATFIKTEHIPEFNTSALEATIAPYGNFTVVNSSKIYTEIVGKMVHVFGAILVSGTQPTTISTSFQGGAVIAGISNCYIRGTIANNLSATNVTVPAFIHNVTSGNWELKPITLQIYAGYIAVNIEGGNITTDALQTTQFDVYVPLNRC